MSTEADAPRPEPVAGARGVIDVIGLDASGAGVGSWECADETWEVRVPHVLPGERARVQIEHRSRGAPVAFARRLELIRAHPRRRPAACVHHPDGGGSCGGCPLMTLEEQAQRELKAALVEREHGLVLDRIVGDEGVGYRMSSKRVAGGEAGRLALGSFRPRAHEVASMRHCLVDHPRIVECFAELEDRANALSIEPYDERTRTGDLRYAWAKCDGVHVLLTLVTASAASRAATALAPELRAPAGVAWSVQAATGNAIRGEPATLLSGRDRLEMTLAGVVVRPGPLGFLQPNPAVAARAYEDLCRDADGEPLSGPLALDLYAGAGVVTRRLRERFESVRACEVYPESAGALGVDASSVEDFLARADIRRERPQLVVANPPRAGMGPRVCDALVELAPQRITIMSCNVESLARDLESLAEGYVVQRLRGYDTLPQTRHLELVAWLARRPNSSP